MSCYSNSASILYSSVKNASQSNLTLTSFCILYSSKQVLSVIFFHLLIPRKKRRFRISIPRFFSRKPYKLIYSLSLARKKLLKKNVITLEVQVPKRIQSEKTGNLMQRVQNKGSHTKCWQGEKVCHRSVRLLRVSAINFVKKSLLIPTVASISHFNSLKTRTITDN